LGEILHATVHATDLRKATQVMQAMMMKMVKLDINPLQDAYVRPRYAARQPRPVPVDLRQTLR